MNVSEPNDPAKDRDNALMANGPDSQMEMPGFTVNMDPDEGKDSQRHGAGNKGLLEDDETRTSLFKKCAVAAAGLLLLSFAGSVCLSRARETGVKAGGPVATRTLPLEISPRRQRESRGFRKLRRFLQGGGADDAVTPPLELEIILPPKRQDSAFRKLRRFLQGGGASEVGTMAILHDDWEAMCLAVEAGQTARWMVERRGRPWTGEVKYVSGCTHDTEDRIENSPECNGEPMWHYQLLNGFKPPINEVKFDVKCCGDWDVNGACTISCDCLQLEKLAVAFEGGGDYELTDDVYYHDAWWFQGDPEAMTYECIVEEKKSLEECCRDEDGNPAPHDNGLCTLLSCVDTTDVTLNEECSCHDIYRGCKHMAFLDDIPLCQHLLTCCGATTESLDFNQCIAQLIPEKDKCAAIYGEVCEAFACVDSNGQSCKEGAAAGNRQLQVNFPLDEPEHDPKLENEFHHEQQDPGRRRAKDLCGRRNYNRRALSETDLVSDMKLRGGLSCLEEDYELAVQAIGLHLVIVAFPQGESDCPVAVADSGYTNDNQEVRHMEGVPVLTKHLTLIESDRVTEEDFESVLLIGNMASLTAFHDAIQSARTSASKDSAIHGVVGNCVTFILDVMTELQVDFGEKEMQTKLISFVVQALLGPDNKDAIVANIKKKINNRAVKAWMKLRGDKYVVKKYVKTFLKNYKSE